MLALARKFPSSGRSGPTPQAGFPPLPAGEGVLILSLALSVWPFPWTVPAQAQGVGESNDRQGSVARRHLICQH